MKDKHDPRDFNQFVVLNDDGSVAAVKMATVESGHPIDGEGRVHLNVTALGPVPLDAITIDTKLVSALKQSARELEEAALIHAHKHAAHQTAQKVAQDAFHAAAKAKR